MSHEVVEEPKVYALVAEFETPEQLIAAAERTREAGYKKIEAYTPYPVHGLSEALDQRDSRIFFIVFIAGCTGALIGAALQSWISYWDYPVNSGGRPYISWPSFFPVTYELTILCAAFGAVLGMLALNGLPRPYHPIFNTPDFDRASQDRFFLAIEATDRKYDRAETERFLKGLEAFAVSEVAP